MPFRTPHLPDDPRQAVRWVRAHLPARLPTRLPDMQAGGRDVADWISERLPRAIRPAPRRRMPEPTALILPAVLAAAGAGAAFWWWTQWSRGRAEALAAEEGAAHPEAIMEHSPPPSRTGTDAPNPSDDRLTVPAEEVMAHSPPPPSAKSKGKLKAVSPVVAPVAEAALKRSLAVQASAKAPKPKRGEVEAEPEDPSA